MRREAGMSGCSGNREVQGCSTDAGRVCRVLEEPQLLQAAARLVCAYAPDPGVHPSAVPGLTLYRLEQPGYIARSAGEIMTTFIIAGRKSTAIGGRILEYGPGESLVCGIASPSEFRTLECSAAHPFLAVSVALNLSILMEYAGQMTGMPGPGAGVSEGVFVIRPDEDLALAFLALLRLLDRPELIAIRAPLLLRELHALLLDSACGPQLRALASAGSEGHAVLNAVNWLRTHFASSESIGELARRANMSSATFHRKFRQVTGFSPVQFRKRVRLFEARRQLIAREANVTTAAYAVGYESPAQFVRDYKGLFGAPPLKDVRRLSEGRREHEA